MQNVKKALEGVRIYELISYNVKNVMGLSLKSNLPQKAFTFKVNYYIMINKTRAFYFKVFHYSGLFINAPSEK